MSSPRLESATRKASRLPARCVGSHEHRTDRSHGRARSRQPPPATCPFLIPKTRSEPLLANTGAIRRELKSPAGRKLRHTSAALARSASHAGQLVETAEQLLENSVARPSQLGRKSAAPSLASTALVHSFTPTPLRHGTPGELIHNHQFIALHNILLIPMVKLLARNQCLNDQSQPITVVPPPQAREVICAADELHRPSPGSTRFPL